MDNHTWFNKGVTRWLDIALYKVCKLPFLTNFTTEPYTQCDQ